MASLLSLNSKLDHIVKSLSSKKAQDGEGPSIEKPPTQEEIDEERLREIEAKIEDITDLLSQNLSRESVDKEIEGHENRVKSTSGESVPYLRVYHDHGGKRIPTTRRTQAKMKLAESLKTRIRLAENTADLEHGLHILVKEQIEILKRQLSRHGSSDSSKEKKRAKK